MPQTASTATVSSLISQATSPADSNSYLAPFTLTVQVNAYYVIFAANAILSVFLISLIYTHGGLDGFKIPKNILLISTLVFTTSYHFAASHDIGMEITTASYLRNICLALAQISFMMYQWVRCFPVIEAECSPNSVRTFRIILIVAATVCIGPSICLYFGMFYVRLSMVLSGIGVLTSILFFGTVSYRSLTRKRDALITMHGKEAMAVQVILIIARYGARASAFSIMSFFAYILATIVQTREVQTDATRYIYCVSGIAVNLFFLMGTNALVLMKWKLDSVVLAHMEIEDSVPESTGGAPVKQAKASQVPDSTAALSRHESA
ncbi:hypothetical protein BJ741DRAFT_625907 [Chytriomyces cf. hyalinus JEL632]|nr:hypothetical protein BJ741DRAFT_625907 [Chytriomyces cf. hyalinus JEL632]